MPLGQEDLVDSINTIGERLTHKVGAGLALL
jgi:hypothetical protein